jgi:hypothetical protein
MGGIHISKQDMTQLYGRRYVGKIREEIERVIN